ncbi:MAG: hypothetical protein WCS27_16405 [Victivallaceae bacterium]
MKFLPYVFLGCAISLNLCADVAKPKSSNPGGALPAVWSSTTAQERLKALRVAQLDAYRALAARVYGFQFAAGTIVYDYALKSDTIHSRLETVLKGAAEMEEPEYTDKGMVMVVYGLKLEKIFDVLKIDRSFNSLLINKQIQHQGKIIEALGCGALPGSMGLKMLHAKRAAELDAYRLLAERLVGVKINSETSVAGLCLKNDKVEASLAAFLKGLKPVGVSYQDDGACSVTVQLKIREVVETIENLIRVYNSGNADKITDIRITTNDKIFKATGHGAPRDDSTVVSLSSGSTAQTILHKIIKKEIVVE